MEQSQIQNQEFADHFFREEYGKMVGTLTRYLGATHVETAEDIVQEALLAAIHHWEYHGVPDNPRAWIYAAAKNKALNILKRKSHQDQYLNEIPNTETFLEGLEFSDEQIKDGQLRTMFLCCHPSLSEPAQITLILKVLCGFSIAEIANAWYSNTETINKRLVRARGQLREQPVDLENLENIQESLPVILKTIYLLFNEGYHPSQKADLIRPDLCLEAIRLSELLMDHPSLETSLEMAALLALMKLNAARFSARMNEQQMVVELEHQDRSKWSQQLINEGIVYLERATQKPQVSLYLILATISAQHCIARSFAKTDWVAILRLYDQLVLINDSPLVRLNRIVALAKAQGHQEALNQLAVLGQQSNLLDSHLFHATKGQILCWDLQPEAAKLAYEKALSLADNPRDREVLQKKI